MIRNLNIKFNKGVSIVEMLVVMLVFVIVASLGFQAITSFKFGSELSSAGSEFESTVKTVQNNARNNVVSRSKPEAIKDINSATAAEIFDSQTDAYLLFFYDETFEVRSCKKDNSNGDYICFNLEPISAPPTNLIKFNPLNSGCSGILYKNLSGEMILISSSVSIPETVPISITDQKSGECNVEVKHVNQDFSRKYNYKFTTNGNRVEKTTIN